MDPAPNDEPLSPIRQEARRLHGLLAALREACAAADSDAAQQHHDAAMECVAGLLRDPALSEHEELAEDLGASLDEVEDEARSLFADTTIESERLALRLAGLRCSIRQLRRLIRVIAGNPVRDEVPFLLGELRDAEHSLRRAQGEAEEEDPAAEDEVSEQVPETSPEHDLGESRVRVLGRHVDRLLAQVEGLRLSELDDAGRAFRLGRSLDVTRFRLAEDADELGESVQQTLQPLVQRVDDERIRLLDRAYAFLDSRPPLERLAQLVAVAPSVLQEIDQARVSSTETARPRDIALLLRLETKARRFRSQLCEALAAARAEPPEKELLRRARRALRQLARQIRVARRVRTDQMLSRRLARFFGERTVRLWEGLVFWLIVGVLGLLVLDHYRDPDPEGVIGWTVWVDTVICGLLLLDFATRVAMHTDRLSYFLRHAITDLLPSLPFGLITNLHMVADLRWTRTLRLVRVFRVLRLLRPVLRFVRLFLFLSRALDRLVERYSWVLNRNLIFLTEGEISDRELPVLKRVRDLDLWITRSSSRTLARLPRDAQAPAARWRARWVSREVDHCPLDLAADVDATRLRPAGAQSVEVDDAVRFLRDLDDGQVAELVGFEFARDLTHSLRFFRLPVLRRLGPVRYLVGQGGAPDPLITTARLGNLVGDGMARTQRLLQWFADLHGTITGSQFLDRLGLHLVQATARPTKRLLMFAVGLVVAVLLVEALRMDFLDPVVGVLLKLLLGPVALIGVLCAIPLLLGTWFRRIAGRVADLYDRVAEGQFVAQTEISKERAQDHHLAVLGQRVLAPEARLKLPVGDPRTRPGSTRDALDEEVVDCCWGWLELHSPAASPGTRTADAASEASRRVRAHAERVLLFYREFADGGLLHRSDTKVASLLLGNLTLENIRLDRLRWTEKDNARLQRLDLAAGRGGLTGPGIWFRFITRAVSHHVARLVLEYDHHCIRQDELEAAHEDDRVLYRQWLDRREVLSRVRRVGGEVPSDASDPQGGNGGTLTYRTTEFHALHFLCADEHRDESVRERFGPRVLELVREDRRQLVRDVFGTFPARDLPPERRVLNPYEFYTRYCSRGRFVLLPFVFGLFALRGLRLLSRRVAAIVRDVVRPHDRPLKAGEGHAGFAVARRKIHRMRRPVALEALRLRARFDPEYLGIALPGRPLGIRRGLAADLRELNASQREWEEFRNLKSQIEPRIVLLGRMLDDELPGEASDHASREPGQARRLEARLAEHHPGLAGHPGESLRAMALAFVCDHQHLWSLAEAHHRMVEFLQQLPEPDRSMRLPPLWPRRILRLAARHWPAIAGERAGDKHLWRTFRDDLLEKGRSTLDALETLEQHRGGRDDVPAAVVEGLLAVAEQPAAWNEQIVSLRTVQTLAMLDIEGYEKLVAELGEYPPAELERRRAAEGRSDL